MNILGDIPESAKAAIQAHPWFAGVPVYVDDGNLGNRIEEALSTQGICVCVGWQEEEFIPDLTTKSRNSVFGTVRLLVAVLFSALQNAQLPVPRDIGKFRGSLLLALRGNPEVQGRLDFEIGTLLRARDDDGVDLWILPIERKASISA